MALMKDRKPEKYAGERLVWEQLQKNLPDEIIVYYNRELNGREFDFCLLIPDMGFLILEVKGWHGNDVERVTAPDEIWLYGEEKPMDSPKKQARGYRFALINQLQQRYHIDPLVMDMVCYPFMSEREYQSLGLSIVSEPLFTLFAEDLASEANLSRKISRAYMQLHRAAEDSCTGEVYDVCRRHFEPDYIVKPPMPTALPYSRLSVFDKPLTIAEIKHIMQSYFGGTKQILFVHTPEDLEALADNLTELFRDKNLCDMHGNLRFGQQTDRFQVKYQKLSAFQFEAMYVGEGFFPQAFTVYDGALSDEQAEQLSRIPQKRLFNIDQYRVEHAPVGRDIQVLAGAGTGKTYSMVSRIAYLCHPASNSGVYAPADEIAMLTFTSDAAVNMKSRLKRMFMNYFVLTQNTHYLELVSDIEKMRISTIHSFAGEVFKNTALALGIGSNYTTISGNYDHNIIFDRVFDAYLIKKNQESPLFFEDLPMSIYDFQKYIRQIPAMLYNKGCDIKEAQEESFGLPPEAMPYLQEIIQEVVIPAEQEYEKALAENNALHLSEYMIYLRKCIAFEGFNANLFGFKYLFIDEFQDTDDAQIEAFLAMQDKIGFHFFIVGDLKQSIYRFRGATMDAFRRMGTESDLWLEYHLTINYRTDARLLDMFDTVFSDMGKQKLLPYQAPADRLVGAGQDDSVTPEQILQSFSYQQTQVASGEYYDTLFEIVNKQKCLIEQKMRSKSLSLAERTIAILTRTNYQIETLVKEARKRNIQLESTAGGDLYQLQSTLDLCKLTAALCNPYHPSYLYDLIRSNNVKVELDPRVLVGMEEQEKTGLLIRCLDEFYSETLQKTWKDLIYEVQHKPVLMVLRIIYEGTEPWKRWSDNHMMQAFYRANYDLLFEELSQMNKKSYLTLDSVHESLHIAVSTGAEREPRNLDAEQEGIRLLCTTVHKSKGLEYDTVILPLTDRDSGKSRQNGIEVTYVDGKIGYCISTKQDSYANSCFDAETEIHETQMEEARILYVAMTRAIQHFIWFRREGTSKWSWGGLLEGLYCD